MPLTPLQLPVGSNRSKFAVEGDSRLVNGFAEDLGEEGKSRFALYAMAGLAPWAQLIENGQPVRGRIRALLVIGSTLYVVIGSNVVLFDINRTPKIIGNVAAQGNVYMRGNRRRPAPQIGIVAGGQFSVIDTGDDSFVRVVVGDGTLPAATGFTVLDGYGIIALEGDRWIITNADDFTTISLNDIARAEASEDALVRPFAFNRQLWLLGTKTTEIWTNTGPVGDGTFPFTRTTSFEEGCLAGNSVVSIDEQLLWVAADGTVKQSSGGYSGQRISNHGVERAIKAEPDPSALTATAWTDEGHHFYALSGTNFTYQYDLTTQSWSERESYNSKRWRIDHVARFQRMLIAGDIENGRLYEMSSDYLDEAGEPLVMKIGFPPTHAFPARVIFDAMFVDIVAGKGTIRTPLPSIETAFPSSISFSLADRARRGMTAELQSELRRLGAEIEKFISFTEPGFEPADDLFAPVPSDIIDGLSGNEFPVPYALTPPEALPQVTPFDGARFAEFVGCPVTVTAAFRFAPRPGDPVTDYVLTGQFVRQYPEQGFFVVSVQSVTANPPSQTSIARNRYLIAKASQVAESDPQIIIRWSDDGGRTIKGSRRKSMGRLGQTQARVRINRLGMQKRNARRFELLISAAVQRGIIGASASTQVVDV